MSSSTATPVGGHPISDFVSSVDAGLTRLRDTAAWGMGVGEQASVIVDLAKARAGLDELELRVLAAADRSDVAATTAATSTAAWLAHATTCPAGAAQADVKLAAGLDGSSEATRGALASGVIDVERARVIVHAVQNLPEDAVAEEPGLPARAEAHLLGLARTYDWKKLKAMARHLMEVLDPDAAEERLGKKLEAEEAKASRATFLEIHDNGDGTHSGRFQIPSLHAAMVKKALDAIMNPARHATGQHPDGASGAQPSAGQPAAEDPATGQPAPGEQRPVLRPRPQQLGQAFCEFLERFPADLLPTAGGVGATVVIHIDMDAILTGLGIATLDTGQTISAGQARRLACEAGVIPAVIRRLVDGTSVVMDMGRERRLHTKHMRIALGIEQHGCTTEGCDRPPGWCQAHHEIPWIPDGVTSVENGRLLCRYHHTRAHSPAYDMTRLPDGKVRFNRRT